MEPHWTASSLESQLRKVATFGENPATAFIVGGGAMVIHGFRERAPDLDVLVDSFDRLQIIDRALIEAGFTGSKDIATEAEPTNLCMYHDDAFRDIDLWTDDADADLNHRLTDGVRDRSESFVSGEYIDFRVISREDLIVSKLLTERLKDLSDFRSILETDLDRTVIRSELVAQCELQDREVPSMLFLGSFEN